MESKRIQNRKANRDRAALIYMSAISGLTRLFTW